MRRLAFPLPVLFLAALLAALVQASSAPALASEVKVAGDFRVHGSFFQNRNFTGWNGTGTQTGDTFSLWQRLRLRFDFAASENLSFRLGLRLDNETWGHGYLTAANPTTAVQPYQCYLQFTVPDSRVTVTAGYQPLAMPQSPVFYDSVVLSTDNGNIDTAALVLSAPLIADRLSVTAGFARLVDANRTYDPTTTQVDDELDLSFLLLPLTVPGFSATPWGAYGVIGQGATLPSNIQNNIRSGGSFLAPTGYRNNQNPTFWAGSTFIVSALDPVRVYADVVYGDAGFDDRARNRRHGWFADLALEYRGFESVTPQIFGWASTGEDSSLTNGSERMPYVITKWGPRRSFLFDTDQEFTAADATMAVSPQGTWGLSAGLDNVNVIDNLTSLLGFTLAAGTSSSAGMRKAAAASGGPGTYVQMGKNLVEGEYLLSAYFNHKYMIHEQLALILETGWAHGQNFDKGVWGRRMVNQAADAWQCALGFKYRF